MAKRRGRAARALGGAASGIADVVRLLLQNQLISGRQGQFSEQLAENQRAGETSRAEQRLREAVASGMDPAQALALLKSQDPSTEVGLGQLESFQPPLAQRIQTALEPFTGALPTEVSEPLLRRRLTRQRVQEAGPERPLGGDVESVPAAAPELKLPELPGAVEGASPAPLQFEETPGFRGAIEELGTRRQGVLGEEARQEARQVDVAGRVTKAQAQASQDVREGGLEGRMEEARRLMEMRARFAEAEGLTSQQQSGGLALAVQFNQQSSDFFKIQSSFKTVATLSQLATPISDVGLIFALMKMFDPNSTVREGEQAQARNAAGVPERIRNTYNQLLSGTSLGPEGDANSPQRLDAVNTAKALFTEARAEQQGRVELYTERAAILRVPPQLVVQEPSQAPEGLVDLILRERSGGR